MAVHLRCANACFWISSVIVKHKSLFQSLKHNQKLCCYQFGTFHPTVFCSSRITNQKLLIQEKKKVEFVEIWSGITINELTEILNKDIAYVKELFLNEIHDQNLPIYDLKLLHRAINRCGKRMKIIGRKSKSKDKESTRVKPLEPLPPPEKNKLKPRAIVVTVMGHVDHGKTTLLDAFRHSNVVDQEFGGITQHIGAFSVKLSGLTVTFIDTPGHAAFTSMRARGANVTDLIILVVAADDGVMEQTIESISMARKANVPILVAINKIDSPKANIERTEKMLFEAGIHIEKLGGDIQAIPISALKKINLDQLSEALILQSELLQIGGDPTGPVEAIVIESKVDISKGKVATLIVQRGTLKKGNVLVCGTVMAKVRTMHDENGTNLENVLPGNPVEITGWKDLPSAGDLVLQANSEQHAKEIIKIRKNDIQNAKAKEDLKFIQEKQEMHNKGYRERLQLKRQLGKIHLKNEGPRKAESRDDESPPLLSVIIKADVDGTLEALLETINTYDSEQCKLELVHYGVGQITPNDVELATAFKSIIYAFNVSVPKNIEDLAKENNIPIKCHNVIYKLIDDVKSELNIRLPEIEIEEIYGKAEVLQQFEINHKRIKVPVAGCKCTEGVLHKSALYRLIRGKDIVFEGPLSSMRHLKSEVDIVKADTECGLQFSNDLTFEKGDILICFNKKFVTQKTDWDPGF